MKTLCETFHVAVVCSPFQIRTERRSSNVFGAVQKTISLTMRPKRNRCSSSRLNCIYNSVAQVGVSKVVELRYVARFNVNVHIVMHRHFRFLSLQHLRATYLLRGSGYLSERRIIVRLSGAHLCATDYDMNACAMTLPIKYCVVLRLDLRLLSPIVLFAARA